MDNKTRGTFGEVAAINFLKSKGYKIIDFNWETHIGEIDIVAADKDTVVFVEVKTRSSYKYGRPAEAVDKRKQHKLSMMAAQYIKQKRLIGEKARFDVIEVTAGGVNHIINAFDSTINI